MDDLCKNIKNAICEIMAELKEKCHILKAKSYRKAGKMIKFVKMRVLKLMGNLLSCHVGWEPNPALTTLLADSIFVC